MKHQTSFSNYKKQVVAAAILITICCSFVFNGDDFISELRAKMDSYKKEYPRLVLDLFFNQPKYAPGDTVFFRTFYRNSADQSLFKGRQIVYVDVFNVEGQKVIENRVLVNDGIGNNQLVLPTSFQPGYYKFVAYSDWMKNFSASRFFQHELLVVYKNKIKKINSDKIEFTIYPEGGNLISGILNNVVIKSSVTDSSFSIAIKDQNQTLVREIAIDKNGCGEFSFVPQADNNYYVEMAKENASTKFNFPDQQKIGFSMKVVVTESKQFDVEIRHNNIDFQSQKYFFVLASSNGIEYSQNLRVEGNEVLTFPLPGNLKTGVYWLTIIDDHFKVWSTRTIFKSAGNDISVKFTKIDQPFGLRDSVEINFNVSDNYNNPIKGDFSVRVLKKDLFDEESLTLNNKLYLLKQVIPNSFELIATEDSLVNRWLVSQSDKNDPFKELFQKHAISYSHEQYLELQGSVVSQDGKQIPDSTELYFFFQNRLYGYETTTENNGHFDFPLVFDVAGEDDVFFSSTYKGRDIADLRMTFNDETLNYSLKSSASKEFSDADAYGDFYINKKIIDRSFSYYGRKGDTVIQNPNGAIEKKIGKPDVDLDLSKYVVFPTMVDVIREVLPSVDYRKIKGQETVGVYTTNNKKPTRYTQPLYVINGYFTKDTRLLLSLNPKDIESIKVVKDNSKLQRIGSLGDHGLIIARLKDAKPFLPGSKNDVEHFQFRGFNASVKSYPRHTVSKRTPDLRSCLFWNSNQVLSNGRGKIKFLTSDDVAEYLIQIQGVADDGRLFSSEKIISTRR